MVKTNRENFGFLGGEFQLRLIAQLLHDTKFAESIIDIISPNYFEDQHLKIIVSTIKEAYQEYEIIPDFGSLEYRLMGSIPNEYDQKYALAQLSKIKETTQYDALGVQDTAMLFCKQQELIKALKDIQKIINAGDINKYPECEDILKKAMEHGDNRDDTTNVCDDVDDVLADDFRKPIPTGVNGLDDIMNGGLSKGELGIILAPFGVGKAQPLTSKILTPNGWTIMGKINVGDDVISRNGKQTKVVGVYPQGLRPIYRVLFNDGTSTLCDKEHLWSVKSPYDNLFKVKKTSDIINDIKINGENYEIPIVEPVKFIEKEIPFDPYLLGVILGNRRVIKSNNLKSIINANDKIKIVQLHNEELNKQTNRRAFLNSVKNDLTDIGLYGCSPKNKFIPKNYLYNSIDNRVKLLQGLVDINSVIKKNRIEITIVSKIMYKQIRELVLSLGGHVFNVKRKRSTNNKSRGYCISFNFPNTINFKLSRLTNKLNKLRLIDKNNSCKFIKSIEFVGNQNAQCIMVDNPEHLYVTDDYIVTHNTTLITKIANTAKNLGYNVLQIFFEDQAKVIKRKHYSCWSGYDLNELSFFKDEIKELIKKKNSEPGILKLKRFSSEGVTIPLIRKYIRKLISQGFKPDIVLLDYIDCVEPSKSYDDANVGEGKVMRQFESMLYDFNMAGWTAIQGNRDSLKSEVVESHQMGGSIKKGQIGHFVVSIAKTLDQKENGTATMAILKSRFGKDGIVLTDVKFDNGRIQIDMTENSGEKTRSQFKNDKDKEEKKHVSNLLDALKAKKALLSNDNEK